MVVEINFSFIMCSFYDCLNKGFLELIRHGIEYLLIPNNPFPD